MTPLALSAALFYAGQRQAASHTLIREGQAVAATLTDPLRGDPDDEQHHRIVEPIRPEPVDRGPWGGV